MTTTRPLTRSQAIAAKCRACIYDDLEVGNWRQQCGACAVTECPLWAFRPQSRPHKQKPD